MAFFVGKPKCFMRKLMLLCALGATYVCAAQKVKLTWSEESKKELKYGSLVQGNGTEMIKLCFDVEGGMFKKTVITPILSRYNNRLQEQGVRSFVADQEGLRFDNLLSVRNNLFLFTNFYDKEQKATTYYAQKIESKTLAPDGKPIALGTLNAISRFSQSSVNYELSKDSSKVLFFGQAPYKKKQTEKYFMGVYDVTMKKIWDNTVELPYQDKFIDILDYIVTNNGQVGVILKHYDREVKKENVREDGARVPAYKTKLLVYSQGNTSPKEYLLNLQDKYIHTLQLTADKSSNLTLFGLYKNKHDGYINGYIIVNLDQTTQNVSVKKMEAFPSDMLTLVENDKQGSDREKDPGISSHFMLADVVERADGSVDYLLEYYKLVWRTRSTGRYTTVSYPDYYYGDIIDIRTHSTAPTAFTRIPKLQHTPEVSMYSSFKAITQNNKLVLFYNDDRDNVERDITKKPDDMVKFGKSILAMAVVDQKNNLTRSQVYSHRDMKLTTCVAASQRLATNKIGLYALKGEGVFTAARDMVGLLEVN